MGRLLHFVAVPNVTARSSTACGYIIASALKGSMNGTLLTDAGQNNSREEIQCYSERRRQVDDDVCLAGSGRLSGHCLSVFRRDVHSIHRLRLRRQFSTRSHTHTDTQRRILYVIRLMVQPAHPIATAALHQ